ncbi:hypothetical protein [Micromonospora sp. NPDC048947]|uniref:hypothetical protein n=1 Tax=Micromonospora sp. NPDC048947 TaxID=3154826 RepID=UPI0033D113F6
MAVEVVLGEVTCPSGHLVIMDGGYLELWSGDRVPDDEERPATDFAIVGPDAEAAADSFDRQTGTRLYDIPAHAVAEFTATFDEHCREHGHGASLRAFRQQFPHRERVRHAVAAREPGFIVMGVPVLPIEVPAGRPLRVTRDAEKRTRRTEIRVRLPPALASLAGDGSGQGLRTRGRRDPGRRSGHPDGDDVSR